MQLSMGIIKIEVSLPEAVRAFEEFRQNRITAFETLASEVRSAVSGAINQLLHAEMTLFLGGRAFLQEMRNLPQLKSAIATDCEWRVWERPSRLKVLYDSDRVCGD